MGSSVGALGLGKVCFCGEKALSDLMKWDVTEMAETGTYLLLRDTKEMPR